MNPIIMNKNSKLSGNNILIITLCILSFAIILIFNSLNSSISSDYKATLSRFAEKDPNLELLQKAKDEMMLADNQYRYFLYTADTTARLDFINNVTNTVEDLRKVKYFDSNYISGIKTDIDKKLAVSQSILLLKAMADSLLTKASVIVNGDTTTEKIQLEQIKVSQLQKYSNRSVDTLMIVSRQKKRNIFDRIGTLFSGKRAAKDNVELSYKKGNEEVSTSDKKNRTNSSDHKLAGDINRYYQDILDRQMKLRNDAAAKEKQFAMLNLALIGNINEGISILLDDYKAVELSVRNYAKERLDRLSRRRDYLIWGSTFAILLVTGLLIRSMLKVRKYENELIASREKSDNLAMLKTRVLSTVSHEIRSPLTAVLGFAEQISSVTSDKKVGQFIQAVNSSAEHMLNMVNDILDFSKLDAGKVRLNKKTFLLKAVLEDIILAFSQQAAKKNIALRLKTNFHESLMIYGDEVRLKQILFNLVSNAIKFTHKGFVELNASVKIDGQKTELGLSVKDTGIGIPSDQLDAVFEEFTQVQATASKTGHFVKGTGLGLSICRKLIQLQDGSITVESKIGEGTVFHVKLPFESAGDKPSATLEKQHTIDEEGLQQIQKKHVLVVEDNELNVILLTVMLKHIGPGFDIARDGNQALSLFRANKYDLVLTDINIPFISGVELAGLIRSDGDAAKAATPVIALTANVLAEDIDSYYSAGISDVLVKPFREQQIREKLMEYLNKSSDSSTGTKDFHLTKTSN